VPNTRGGGETRSGAAIDLDLVTDVLDIENVGDQIEL